MIGRSAPRVTALAADTVIVAEARPAAEPSAAVRARIETIWERERGRRGARLFNGQLFGLSRAEGSVLHGSFVPYKHWLAQFREPALYGELGIRPLAVNGLAWLGPALLFGRRAGFTTEYPGSWELVPSGGINEMARDPRGRISAAAQLLSELDEELNLPATSVERLAPRNLVEDLDGHTCDLYFEFHVRLSPEELRSRFAARSSDEYEALQTVERRGIDDFLLRAPGGIVPSARAMLAEVGWISEAE